MAIGTRTNAVVPIAWKDGEHNRAINLAQIEACRVTLFDVGSETTIRRSENYLDAAHSELITLPTDGKMKLYLTPLDTDMVGDYEVGDAQPRTLYVRLGWGSESFEELTDPFTTTDASRDVLVTQTAHGLAVGDNVFFETDQDVGGLDLADMWVVSEVVDADSYKFKHREAALAVATGGGNVTAWINGRSASATAKFVVVADDPI